MQGRNFSFAQLRLSMSAKRLEKQTFSDLGYYLIDPFTKHRFRSCLGYYLSVKPIGSSILLFWPAVERMKGQCGCHEKPCLRLLSLEMLLNEVYCGMVYSVILYWGLQGFEWTGNVLVQLTKLMLLQCIECRYFFLSVPTQNAYSSSSPYQSLLPPCIELE